MKAKISMVIFPTIGGILAVIAILLIFNIIFHKGDVLYVPDNGFLSLFVPVTTICALIVQSLLTLRFWERFKRKERVIKLNIYQFTILITIIGGIIFGFIFWEKIYGISELIEVTITGIGAFAIYWIFNLLILYRLDKV